MSMRRVEQHADWLALVEPEGQFLSVPVLKRAFPSGLEGIPRGLRQSLRDAAPKNDTPQSERDAWIDLLLRDVLAWGPQYVSGDAAAQYRLELPLYATTLTADAALIDPATQKPRVLVSRCARGTDFAARIRDERWNASPIDRLTSLCQANGARIGVLADGENLCVVWSPTKGVGGYATFDTALFTEGQERSILQAFISLFGARRFFAVEEPEQIEALFERSAAAQAEVTKDLGRQVRDAVELLVSSISEKNLARSGDLLRGVPPQQVYEAAVTVMMRVVFLLFAEERGLLPLDDDLYATSYAASTLRSQLVEDAESDGDEPLRLRGAAWFRLLALARVIYAGTHHDRLHLPAYGGRLFDPERFEFLERFPIDDLTMLAILDAIQTLPIAEGGSKERRRLSFRTLDVEQIGHVYEGLLDHGADRIDETYLGLQAKTDNDEVTLREIEDRAKAAGSNGQPLVSFFADQTGRSPNAIEKDLERGKALVAGSDPEKRRLLRSACDNDDALMQRVAPYAYLLRNNLQHLPSVYVPQSLIVRHTRARRDSGTEYTPRELAEEIVKYALEPLCYAPHLKPSEELLALKICDPAVGSGAFLVAACRYLADRVVEAWVAEDAEKAKADRDDLTLEARRLVVGRCLYGVDKDAMAVDMAKLSLWLVTMARERPFSFLDHTVRHGDSLLGIHTLDQLRYLHIDPEEGQRVHASSQYDEAAKEMTARVDEAARLCVELEAIPVNTIRQAREKQALNERAIATMSEFSDVADALTGIALKYASASQRQRDEQFRSLGPELLTPGGAERIRVSTMTNLQSGRPDNLSTRVTFHWPLAFPEVFSRSQPGFNTIIGNPPFMGGKNISGNLGTNFRSYLAAYVCSKMGANTDLVACFFLRAALISRSLALISVKTIAESGETREASLEYLASKGWSINRAIRKRPWPGSAGVTISLLWMSCPGLSKPQTICQDVRIGIDLRDDNGLSFDIYPLSANYGIAFQGVTILGDGFCITPLQAKQMLATNARNSDVIYEYVIADDICHEPHGRPTKYVIDFGTMSISEAEVYENPFEHVHRYVLPERQAKIAPSYKVARDKWWQFWRRRPELRLAVSGSTAIIAIPRHSKFTMPLRYAKSSNIVFSDAVVVIADPGKSLYPLLSSSIHNLWALRFSGTIDGRPRYTHSKCFETFPLAPLTGIAQATLIMESIDKLRDLCMSSKAYGMTEIYNDLHDNSIKDLNITSLRELHEQLDRAVCDAYGWSDLDLGYGFHDTEEGQRWTLSANAREEVLRRLLALNKKRYEEEEAAGRVPGAEGRNMRKAKAPRAEGISLFPDPP